MRYISLYENFNPKSELDRYFFKENGVLYLHHFTLTDNVDSIKKEGLVPRKYPNSHYENGCAGVFLTTKSDTYSANLPAILVNILEDFYNDHEDEEVSDEDSPITLLKIRVDNLDYSKFRPDDDYVLNIFKSNKAKSMEEQVVESIDVWGAVCYQGIIPSENIIEHYPLL